MIRPSTTRANGASTCGDNFPVGMMCSTVQSRTTRLSEMIRRWHRHHNPSEHMYAVRASAAASVSSRMPSPKPALPGWPGTVRTGGSCHAVGGESTRFELRLPPSRLIHRYSRFARPSDADSSAWLNCGHRFELGNDRTSATIAMRCSLSSSRNRSIGCVECPIVKISEELLRAGGVSRLLQLRGFDLSVRLGG